MNGITIGIADQVATALGLAVPEAYSSARQRPAALLAGCVPGSFRLAACVAKILFSDQSSPDALYPIMRG